MDGMLIHGLSETWDPFLASNFLAILMSLPKVAEHLAFLDTLYLDLIALTLLTPDP